MSGLLLPGAVSAASTTSSGSAPLRPSRSGALCRQPLGLQLAAAPPARRLASSPRTADCARWRRVQQQHKLATAAAADADAAALAAAAAEPEQQQQQQAQAQPHAADPAAADPAAAAAMGSSADGAAVEAAPKKKSGSLAKRVVFGVILGLSGAAVIIIGGWVYAGVACLAAFQLSQEYIGLVSAKGIAKGAPPPPPIVNSAISLLCVALNAWVFVTGGRSASAMAVASFVILSLQLLVVRKPRFAQLTSSLFGLFYCGYLPSFWIRLRLLSVPAVNSGALAATVPALLGGPTHLTVGLMAAFVAVACIIAADTGAYFCGKSFGRTQLTRVSPKKTVEGALGGLLSSIAVALGLYKTCGWPDNSLSAAALGTLVFFSSLFGDLIESVIKRDAGLKDASNLIPGHGGLLDRLDSYLFTGACVYFWIKFLLTNLGI
ncbi:Phosphatidate cytidylyltransferase [Micractinium conductrix]|uniref:Phosphatidate cytidylyltransferase n=1 Tax=Micractinium conductrix TaxID=554055 RepID=A0A2P6VNE5_9CHLO|nr:Phosphatidate cytidylyltransferase [Micractinium conductrix]|eukprot:PSC75575.1 Phosphatidate cytidylyltransferase [Micractinium conductrix]